MYARDSPFWISSDANVWRRSWKRIRRKPAGVDNGVTVSWGKIDSGAGAETHIGINADAGGNKVVSESNPVGQKTRVIINTDKNKDLTSLAVSVGHEGIHVAHGTALIDALPANLANPGAAAVLAGPLNLTQYYTEFRAYKATSFFGQALGLSNISIPIDLRTRYDVWNSSWSAVEIERRRTEGINGGLADPMGLYNLTPDAPGKKLID
jgi:hypothetical protein